MDDTWGWAGSVVDFLSAPRERWLADLESHHVRLWGHPAGRSQVVAWRDEHEVVFEALQVCVAVDGDARRWSVVFEYELPLEGGRRPDVVVLAGATVVVLELKSTGEARQADLDQAAAYARDLAEYHAASHGRTVVPILVLVAAKGHAEVRHGVTVTGPDALARYLDRAAEEGVIDLRAWLESPYEPLPTLVAAARRIFRNEPLPHVRRARSAGVPETVELLSRLCREAAEGEERVLALVAGVPGAGKTLVGLRLVYEHSPEAQATFLSGNGPLVKVLQNALGSRVFVRDLHAFVKDFGIDRKVPGQHIVVFDEAQRAWDRAQMLRKRQVDASEPELLVAGRRAGARLGQPGGPRRRGPGDPHR